MDVVPVHGTGSTREGTFEGQNVPRGVLEHVWGNKKASKRSLSRAKVRGDPQMEGNCDY